jgi:hypothetical protein
MSPLLKGIAVTELKGLPVTREEFEASRKPFCLLCGRPTVSVCLYFPGPSSPIAHPQGRGRVILYSLCDDCDRQRQSLYPAIEAVIEREVIATLKHVRQTGDFALKGQSGASRRRRRRKHRTHPHGPSRTG